MSEHTHINAYKLWYIIIMIIFLLFYRAILTIWFTSRTIKRFFGILPDSQNAASSARSFLNLLSQPAAVENLEDGIIPVS